MIQVNADGNSEQGTRVEQGKMGGDIWWEELSTCAHQLKVEYERSGEVGGSKTC
jgi:hypothetical protein